MWSIGVVSVVASSSVAIVSVFVPMIARRGDRRHEKRLLEQQRFLDWRASRAATLSELYEDVLKGSVHIHSIVRAISEGTPSPERGGDLPSHLRARVDAYASPQVQKRFESWYEAADGFMNLSRVQQKREVAEVLSRLRAAYAELSSEIRRELAQAPVHHLNLEPMVFKSPWDRFWERRRMSTPIFRWFYRPLAHEVFEYPYR